jgi:peptidoglycan hydrolase CwlO-like protein
MRNVTKLFLATVILIVISSLGAPFVHAEDPTETPTPTGSVDNSQQVHDLQNKINEYQTKISEAQTQEHTLSSQISIMDTQMKLTQYRIDATKAKLAQLTQGISIAGNKMKNLEGSLTNVSKVLINRIVATYQAGDYGPMQVFFSSNDITDAVTKANYLRLVQEHDKQLMYDTQQAKNDYANQKQIFQTEKQQAEALQAQLQDYTNQLSQQQEEKKKLLADTQGDEQNYQRLLAQAQAQLAGFQNFTRIQGGASLLSGQTSCDSWGCYYNQRDSQWGDIAINHSPYSIAEDGCLMTSMAMVMTHYGHKTTPLDINANPDNFASYAPAYLRFTISANGATAQRVSTTIDSTLSSGNPVIVGISYDGGPYPDHFVVLVSGSNGDYTMNDPFVPNGHNISFSSHYSVGSIREIDKVVM